MWLESEWLGVVEQVLAGMHHALNNRAASLSALGELVRIRGPEAVSPPWLAALDGDVQRIGECARAADLIAESQDTREEALSITDVLEDALVIHRFIHGTRDTRVVVELAGATSAVRVVRWKMVRALTLVVAEVKTATTEADAEVRITADSNEEAVRLVVTGSGATGVAPSGRTYSDLLIESLGGVVSRSNGRIEVRLPLLRSRRASDRR
jgi:C4-dicarboxylate-specific signal transduction histidine kinase